MIDAAPSFAVRIGTGLLLSLAPILLQHRKAIDLGQHEVEHAEVKQPCHGKRLFVSPSSTQATAIAGPFAPKRRSRLSASRHFVLPSPRTRILSLSSCSSSKGSMKGGRGMEWTLGFCVFPPADREWRGKLKRFNIARDKKT